MVLLLPQHNIVKDEIYSGITGSAALDFLLSLVLYCSVNIVIEKNLGQAALFANSSLVWTGFFIKSTLRLFCVPGDLLLSLRQIYMPNNYVLKFLRIKWQH